MRIQVYNTAQMHDPEVQTGYLEWVTPDTPPWYDAAFNEDEMTTACISSRRVAIVAHYSYLGSNLIRKLLLEAPLRSSVDYRVKYRDRPSAQTLP